jgi:hypothetical protein
MSSDTSDAFTKFPTAQEVRELQDCQEFDKDMLLKKLNKAIKNGSDSFRITGHHFGTVYMIDFLESKGYTVTEGSHKVRNKNSRIDDYIVTHYDVTW